MRRSPITQRWTIIQIEGAQLFVCDGPPPPSTHPDTLLGDISVRRSTGYACQLRVKEGERGWYALGPRMLKRLGGDLLGNHPDIYHSINWNDSNAWSPF